MNKVEERIRHILRSCLNVELPEDDVIALAGQIMVAVRNNLKDLVEIDREKFWDMLVEEFGVSVDLADFIEIVVEENPVRLKEE